MRIYDESDLDNNRWRVVLVAETPEEKGLIEKMYDRGMFEQMHGNGDSGYFPWRVEKWIEE